MDLLWIFAKRFVAGKTVAQAVPKIRQLLADDLLITLDILGENVTNKEEPKRFLSGYLEVIETMKNEKIAGGISVKPTMMGMDIDMEECKENISTILRAAKKEGIFLRVDMEGTPYTQRTVELVIDLHKEFDNVGIVLQAYLHRCEDDAKLMIENGINVRLCKGAYKEPADLAIQSMDEIRENFKTVTKLLLADKTTRHGIATHDPKLIDWTREYAAESGIDKGDIEFQMLYGISSSLQKSLAKEGFVFRTYVPFGTHWFPYFFRRLRERKENIWFVIKHMFDN
jgi:proline dehydrogenase